MRTVGVALLALVMVAAPARAEGMSADYRVAVLGGTMTLDFRGDRATGCERRGLCDTTGTVTVLSRPQKYVPNLGFINAAYGGLLGFVPMVVNGTTRAVVHTPGAEDCRDKTTRKLEFLSLSADEGQPARVTIGLDEVAEIFEGAGSSGGFFNSGSADLFANRCAGPTQQDLAVAIPRAFIKRSWLTRRHFTVALSPVRSFAAGGLAGTITSDLRLSFTRLACSGKRGSCRAFNHAVTNSRAPEMCSCGCPPQSRRRSARAASSPRPSARGCAGED